MRDIKHLVITGQMRAFSRVYHVKDADSGELLFRAVPASIWQTSLDVFQREATGEQKAFMIRPHGLFSLTHDVINLDNEVLGTVKRQGLLAHDWLITDARTAVVANLCKTGIVVSELLAGEYQMKIDERVAATLNESRTFFTWRVDLYYWPDVIGSLNRELLVSAYTRRNGFEWWRRRWCGELMTSIQ